MTDRPAYKAPSALIEEPWEMDAREVHATEFIAGLDSQLARFSDALTDRLKKIGRYREFRLAVAMIEKVLDGLYGSMPRKTLLQFQRLNEVGEVILRPKPVTKKGQYMQIVDNDDLKLLINRAIEHDCAICLKRDGQVRSCPLRRALMGIAPPEELVKDGTCNYQRVALENEFGEYI